MWFLVFIVGCFNALGVPKIGITQIMSHESLNAIREAFVKRLADKGFVDGKTVNIVFRNANGDMSNALHIGHTFCADDLDVALAITTASAYSLASTFKKPIIFAGVTNPGALKKKNNITGVSDLPDVNLQIAAIQKKFPRAQRLGFLYNPAEAGANMQKQLFKARDVFTIVDIAVTRPVDVLTVLQSHSLDIDLMFIPIDNSLVAFTPHIIRYLKKRGIPVVTSFSDDNAKEAALTVGVRQQDIGEKAADMMADLLKGRVHIKDIPISYVRTLA